MTLRSNSTVVPDWVKMQLVSYEVAMLDTDVGRWFGVRDGDYEEPRNVRALGSVVHVKKRPYDIYVGRGADPKTGVPGIWGNPFVVGQHGDRGDCIILHREWIVTQYALMSRIEELRGKILGCWCAPDSCHGDTLLYMANRPPLRGI